MYIKISIFKYITFVYKFILDSAGMLVSDETPLECRSPMGHGGLRLGMSVADWSLIRHVGLRRVSDNNNFFVNSFKTDFIFCIKETSECRRKKGWMCTQL